MRMTALSVSERYFLLYEILVNSQIEIVTHSQKRIERVLPAVEHRKKGHVIQLPCITLWARQCHGLLT